MQGALGQFSFSMWVALIALAAGAAGAATQTPLPADVDYPGLIEIDVDLTDLEQRVIRTQQRIPVTPGRMTLMYPRWLPGNHAPTGPIEALSGLIVHARDAAGARRRIEWRRHPLNMYAFDLDVPTGTTVLDIDLQFATPNTAEQGRRVITPDMVGLQWEKALLYPAGHYVSRIRVRPVIRLRSGWGFGTALRVSEQAQIAPAGSLVAGSALSVASTASHQRIQFTDTTLERLVDSPLFAGRYFQRFELDADPRHPVHLDVVADRPALLQAAPAQIAAHRKLVQESVRLFGSRHYRHYSFLLALSRHFDGIGLEHHESSENGAGTGYFADWSTIADGRELLPHEFVHSWNGKFRRPADLWTPSYDVPMQNSLLWVYEGMTKFWGVVLAARSGLWNEPFTREALAWTAAVYGDQRAGRTWRDLQDTTETTNMAYGRARAHPGWQRGIDYYEEGLLLWLDVDAQLRALSRERRSLDDFAIKFLGMQNGELGPLTYSFDDIVATLDAIAPHDWRRFLRSRLDNHGGSVAAPIDDAPWPQTGLFRAGWKMIYDHRPNEYVASLERTNGVKNHSFSLGITIANDGARIAEVVWDSLAFRAGIATGARLVAVNGQTYSDDLLREAVVAAAQPGADGRIELLVSQFDRYRSVSIEYRGGIRYPHLVRIESRQDRLDALLKPRT